MEGPVEFQSAGNPQPISANQRGLDNVLPIEKIIMVHLVIGFKDTSAQGGDQNQTQVVVFQPYYLVGLIPPTVIGGGQHRQSRIGTACRSLMVAIFGEHGQGLGLLHWVGGDDHLLHGHHCGLAHACVPPYASTHADALPS